MLVESAVIGGSTRWARRLDGLAEQYRLKVRELKDDDPDSSRIPHLERELHNLEHLRAFALPLIEAICEWPDRATWGDWLQRLEGIAPRLLKKPAHVLRVLADLRPMATVGPVSLAEVRDVLADRLRSLDVRTARESLRAPLRWESRTRPVAARSRSSSCPRPGRAPVSAENCERIRCY